MKKTNQNYINHTEGLNISSDPISSQIQVKKRKNQLLKIRLDTLIKNAGLSQRQFYKQLGVSRQGWYGYSWGLIDTPVDLKVRIARLLNTDTSVIYSQKEHSKGEMNHAKD